MVPELSEEFEVSDDSFVKRWDSIDLIDGNFLPLIIIFLFSASGDGQTVSFFSIGVLSK